MTRLPMNVQDSMTLALPLAGAGAEGAPALTPGDLMSMLRRRALMIFLLFLLFSGLCAAGFIALWTNFPGYQSESLIECVSNIPEMQLTVTPEQQRLKEDEHERFVQTQAMLLKSPRILGQALQVTAVRETGWFKQVTDKGEEPLTELIDDLSAAPVRGTSFLRVAIECRNPEDPAVIINEVVSQWYHDVRRRAAEDFATEGLEQAKKDKEAIDREIATKREGLRAIADKMLPGILNSAGNNLVAQQVLQHGEQVARLTLELAQLEQYRNIYSNPEGGPITAEDRAIVETDPQVSQLGQAVFFLEQRRAADSEVFGAEHKEVRQLDAQIRAAKDSLDQLRREKLAERQADMREAANTAYLNTQQALLIAQDKLAAAEAQLQDQDRLLFDYRELNSLLIRDIAVSDQLAEHIRGLNRVLNQRTAVRVNVAQPAIKPLERSSPSLMLVPLGAFLSFAFAVGIALAVELLDKSVRTSQDIVRHMDVALLGAVPHADDEEVAIKRVETAVRDAPRSMIAEAFRRIRTALQFSAPAEAQKSIVITSPQPEDGSTTVATNLALVVAQSGRRVLLVDANLRRPGLKAIFPEISREGLSNLLIGEGKLADFVAKSGHPLMDVLGSGPIPPNPVELLGAQHWRGFLSEATAKYEQVIIDTPPVLLASDALVLATSVDGVMLVVRAKRDSRGVARRAWSMLNDVHARIFGAVLNAAQVARGGYYRQQLRAYYDYQHDVDGAGQHRPVAKT